MKSFRPFASARLIACIVLIPLLAGIAEARIGETRTALEGRLFDSGGVMYRDDEMESARQAGMPYLGYLDLIEPEPEVRVYFKTADGGRPSSSQLDARQMPPGWDMHVVYSSGRSVIEVYRRSSPMTDYEMNELLVRQSGDSFWKKVAQKEREPSVFGYEMALENGSLRAKRLGGDSLMVFSAALDTRLAELRDAKRQENAPVSVQGF